MTTTTIHARVEHVTKSALEHYAELRGISVSRAQDELLREALRPQSVGQCREQMEDAKKRTQIIFRG